MNWYAHEDVHFAFNMCVGGVQMNAHGYRFTKITLRLSNAILYE